MGRDVHSSSTMGRGCRRKFYSGVSVCFLMPFRSSCSFPCKTELEQVNPNIYVWIPLCNWKEILCSQQARWRTAFTLTYLSELSMRIDFRSSSTKGTVCRRNIYSGFSDCFLVPVWTSCSFHCKTELELLLLHIYVWSGVSKWKEICFPNKHFEELLSHTVNSQKWACGETYVHLAKRERVAGQNFTLVSQSVS